MKNQQLHNAARKTARIMKILHICKQTLESKATTLTEAKASAAKATGASKATKNNVPKTTTIMDINYDNKLFAIIPVSHNIKKVGFQYKWGVVKLFKNK